LNSVTIPDRYPLPHIQDFTYHLAGCTIFSKIDLIKAYFQIPVAEEDKHKTPVTNKYAIRIMECSTVFPKIYRHCVTRTKILSRIHGNEVDH